VTIRGRIFLKKGRDGPVRGGNPWIFSQAVARTEPATLAPGEWAEICDAGGDSLGVGYYNPATTIAVRMLAFGRPSESETIVEDRLRHALGFRRRFIQSDTNCYRLINGEGDGLAGVVIDRYGEVVVVQLLTAGAELMRDRIVAAINDQIAPRTILERSHGAVRRQEGLADRAGLLVGAPASETIVIENGIRVAVDFDHGQKTGYFLDQRENRLLVRQLGRDSRVLDAYCYAGGFTLAALAGGARTAVAIDTSTRALASTRRNLELNGCLADAVDVVQGEAPRYLADSAAQFDLVVIDPPPFARSLKDAARAGHLYVELNALAMRAVAPGGHLMTFSCSVHFGGEDFVRAVRIAQTRTQRHFRMVRRLGPGPDHPVMLGHAEGEYLTGLQLADLG
jgi:23S rRNA (cytosine1962-C5)-methyltransferase